MGSDPRAALRTDSPCKTQNRIDINLTDATATCLAEVRVAISYHRRGDGATFADACTSRLMRDRKAGSIRGRSISINLLVQAAITRSKGCRRGPVGAMTTG
ncbi:hypothetical protein [Ferrimicrobium acidiphilum]|uniref:hypothetical protein n=1 Tax=Ferrimicrobium acidiphilum TaxID=121039 RepID=UPI0023EF989B|nr:hypothetical protein [Ferrimicrobium acidiphilum]